MRRLLIILLSLFILLPVSAQKRSGTRSRTTASTQTTAKKKTKAQVQQEKAAAQKQRQQLEAQRAMMAKNVKQNLDSVMILDNQIGAQQLSIDSLNASITVMEGNIATLGKELEQLQSELEVKRQRYKKALLMARRNRSSQNRTMFILSADNFSQVSRRMRYLHEYSTYQKAQGELLKQKQAEVAAKQGELQAAKTAMESSLQQVQATQQKMEALRNDCKEKVEFLNRNIATVQQQIQQYKQKEQALDAEIQRIIQEEIEAARRAEAERKRKEEAARKKAEAAERDKARRLAEAKAKAERARQAEAEAKAKRKSAKTEAEKAEAKAAEERAKSEVRAAEDEVKVAEKEEKNRARVDAWHSNDASGDAKLSGDFSKNKGRLPMPITGSYNVVGHYGNYTVPGLRNVTLNNAGMKIRGQQGCAARAVFDGKVSSVFQYGGAYTVMVRHGEYISVYSGLNSVSVSKGQSVKTKQSLGSVGTDADGNHVLQFQLYREKQRLNPESWVK